MIALSHYIYKYAGALYPAFYDLPACCCFALLMRTYLEAADSCM